MRVLNNKQLDDMLDAGGNALALKLCAAVQHGKPLKEMLRQLVWRWASTNVFIKVRKFYKHRDPYSARMFKWVEWHHVNSTELDYENHTERVLDFLEFVRDFRKKDGSIPEPGYVIKAWHLQFSWLEMRRRARHDGVAMEMRHARTATDVERYFRRTNDIEAATALFEQETRQKYDEWFADPSPTKRRSAPLYPTAAILKTFRKRASTFATMREVVFADRNLDWLLENELI